MDLDFIRKTVIVAMFSDDVLLERLVVKGGNALDIIHKLPFRASMDIDFSISDDFEDVEDISRRIKACLEKAFLDKEVEVFDYKFEPRPKTLHPQRGSTWGGYLIQFKLINQDKKNTLLDKKRRTAIVIGTNQQRVFSIDISKYEFCDDKEEAELDDFIVYVYTLPMIAAEKLRALCQQTKEYAKSTNISPRARDFFDIYTILTEKKFSLGDHQQLIESIFLAKEVPLSLLQVLPEYREYHRDNWRAVAQSVTYKDTLKDYDYYFEFLLSEIQKIKI
jgi:predicted nucleotidyltransferase component of viral defense system